MEYADQPRADSVRVLAVLRAALSPIPARTVGQQGGLPLPRAVAALGYLADTGQAEQSAGLWRVV